MRIWHLIVIILAYLVLINTLFFFKDSFSVLTQGNLLGNSSIILVDGAAEKVGFSDSVSVSVVKKRWYGKYHGDGLHDFLYLFWFIPLPMMIHGFSLLWPHIIFSMIVLFLILLVDMKGGSY